MVDDTKQTETRLLGATEGTSTTKKKKKKKKKKMKVTEGPVCKSFMQDSSFGREIKQQTTRFPPEMVDDTKQTETRLLGATEGTSTTKKKKKKKKKKMKVTEGPVCKSFMQDSSFGREIKQQTTRFPSERADNNKQTETQLLGATEGTSTTKKKMKEDPVCKLALLEIKKQIVEFAEDFLVPAIKSYIESAHPKLYGIQTRHVPFIDIALCYKSLEPVFDFPRHVDLFLIADIDSLEVAYHLVTAKREVGAAIRICKAIGQEHLGDMLKNIVGECFRPDECPNLQSYLNDEAREYSVIGTVARAVQGLYVK